MRSNDLKIGLEFQWAIHFSKVGQQGTSHPKFVFQLLRFFELLKLFYDPSLSGGTAYCRKISSKFHLALC